MKKVIIYKDGVEKFSNSDRDCLQWLEINVLNNTFGKSSRWSTELTDPATHTDVRTVTGELIVPEDGSPSYYNTWTEYFYPAEYTIEIIEESLADIKDRKRAELALQSEHANPYLHGKMFYRTMNLGTGFYMYKGQKAKQTQYLADYIAKSDTCIMELQRCNAAVDNATTEEEVNAVTFKVVWSN